MITSTLLTSWFFWGVLSVVCAGLHNFTSKISAARNYSASFFTLWSYIPSIVLGAAVLFLYGSWEHLSIYIAIGSVVSGGIHAYGYILRTRSLSHVDATISLPLLKVVTVFGVCAINVFFFSELLYVKDIIGIVLACAIPLILIDRFEQGRQKNLVKGLELMGMSALLTILATVVNGNMLHTHYDALLAVPLTHATGFLVAWAVIVWKEKSSLSQLYSSIEDVKKFAVLCVISGVMMFGSFMSIALAYAYGPVSLVYALNSHYILIPIILAIIVYNEHWNARKAVAIVLSLLSVVLMH